MKISFNTSLTDFGYMLRDQAVANRASPQIIDAIDRIIDSDDVAANLEREASEAYDAKTDQESTVDDLYEELAYLVKIIDENLDPDQSPQIERALKMAHAALERHKA